MNEMAPVVEVERLWVDYKTSGDRSLRDDLILHYTNLVNIVASRMSSTLPSNVEFGDLVGYGIFGLLDAIEKFDPEREIKFESYAASRIRGAILDGLRASDWVPRTIRTKTKNLEATAARLEVRLGRTPTVQELAKELGTSEEELRTTVRQASSLRSLPLDHAVVDDDEGSITIAETLADRHDGPSSGYEIAELRTRLAEALDDLADKREGKILTLYYGYSLTLGEIGKILGLTESRVCQIHTKAIGQLQDALL